MIGKEKKMDVLVPVKRVIDPYVSIHVKKDGSGVETQNTKMSMNPFDEIALEEAIRWKEKGLIETIVTVSIGSDSVQETLRHALALGADEAIWIKTEQSLYPLQVAKLLKWVVQQRNFEIIIMGKQAIDDDCNQTGQMLASLLEWPQTTFASQVEFLQNHTLRVVREIDTGLETLKMKLPGVITADLRLNEPRYPSLPNIMKAKRKPLNTITVEETGVSVASSLNVVSVDSPSDRKPGKIVKDVSELIYELHQVVKVI